MNEQLLARLEAKLPALTIRCNVQYRQITSLGAGNTIPFLAEPENDLVLAEILRFCSSNNVKTIIVSGGTNFVGMDAPFDGLLIHLSKGDFSKISCCESRVSAGCGVRIHEVAQYALQYKLGGLSLLTGIPGALGGSVVMNAGVTGDQLGNYVLELCGCYPDGRFYHALGKDIEWNYRSTSIPREVVITGVVLQLKPVEPELERCAIQAELEARRAKEPKGRTAGCMFKNVSPDEPAGKLIDQCGLKGFRVGGVYVSNEHANYIVNDKMASERDVINLMCHIKKMVAEKFGFFLRPEVYFLNPASRRLIEEAAEAPKVLVLKGGVSSEREVSLRSGMAVANALRNGGYNVTELDLKSCEMTEEMRHCDVVYPVLHGGFGENGELQKLLEDAGLPFVGSGSVASALVMDKIPSKELADANGIPNAKWCKITRSNPEYPEALTLPIVLKVPREGSTIGIEIVRTREEYTAALERELAMADEILAEEFIEGVEITVPIVDGQVLPAIEIHSPHGFYDYDAKYVYNKGRTEYFCPVRNAAASDVEKAGVFAKLFYDQSGCRDILRVDFIINRSGVPYFLEANNIPGCTATSLVPKAAKAAGISFEKMTSTLVRRALERAKK